MTKTKYDMYRRWINRAWVLIILAGSANYACSPAAKTALEVIAPTAVDIITKLVRDRWGTDADVDEASSECYPAPYSDADWFGDDDRAYVYARCRGKAIE